MTTRKIALMEKIKPMKHLALIVFGLFVGFIFSMVGIQESVSAACTSNAQVTVCKKSSSGGVEETKKKKDVFTDTACTTYKNGYGDLKCHSTHQANYCYKRNSTVGVGSMPKSSLFTNCACTNYKPYYFPATDAGCPPMSEGSHSSSVDDPEIQVCDTDPKECSGGTNGTSGCKIVYVKQSQANQPRYKSVGDPACRYDPTLSPEDKPTMMCDT